MGVTAAFTLNAVAAGAAIDQHRQAKKARGEAERQAALERQALAELQSEEAPAIPTGDDDAARRSRRRSIAARMRGRQSTILTGGTPSEPLGGA